MLKTIFLTTLMLLTYNVSAQREYTVNNTYSRTEYKVSDGNRRFTRFNKDGTKDLSGNIIISNVDGVDFLLGGSCYHYLKRPFSGKKKGDLLYDYYYRVLNNKLNGLQNIGGTEFRGNDYSKTYYKSKKEFVAMISGNLVYHSGGAKRVDQYAVEYTDWLQASLDTRYPPFNFLKTPSDEIIYDLEAMVSIFLDDLTDHLEHFRIFLDAFDKNNSKLPEYLNKISSIKKKYTGSNNVYSTFEELETGTIAMSYGINNDNSIIIKVDPNTWSSTSLPNKWYILYHELGHDVLNLRHGQGGRMMFNYPTKEYTWEEFFDDRQAMFVYIIKQVYPDYDKLPVAF